jgi:Uma2 family endonuclease
MSTMQFKINARTFRKMAADGAFGDTKVELINGRIEMMTSGPAHDFVVTTLRDLLIDRIGREDWTVREEKPLRLGWFWRPLPDVAVVRGHRNLHRKRTPGRLDAPLLIEVSDSSHAKDAGRKLARSLRCGIPAYWIVDLGRRVVEVRDIQSARGEVLGTYTEGQAVPLTLDGREFAPLPVAEILE